MEKAPMRSILRATLCLGLLCAGVAAQAALENFSKIDRPPLRQPLVSLPMQLGDWIGNPEKIDPKIEAESQATEYISRIYVNPKYPGTMLSLWINFSIKGDNMRHSPTICLPSSGYKAEESQTRVLAIPSPDDKATQVCRLAYAKADVVMKVGFWYYIFGEGGVERWVRGLPITSRSSHGRTTRGSGLTVEVFWTSDDDPDSRIFQDFAQALVGGLDPIMPTNRAGYHVP
jgi:Protein of unknown function (DUF3485)